MTSTPTAEQEVDLGRYWSAIVARWWLPLLGLVVGVIVGYLISLGGKQVWNASSTVYLGASYSIIGGEPAAGPAGEPGHGRHDRARAGLDRAGRREGRHACERPAGQRLDEERSPRVPARARSA